MSKKWKIKDYNAKEIADKIKEGIIKVPQYQRGQVWKPKQKEGLMDSIKKGYPFGSILLYKKADNDYELIDGLQRISTIYEYIYNPSKYFQQYNISDSTLDKIFLELKLVGNKETIKKNVEKVIKEWVEDNTRTLEDIKNMNAAKCVKYIQTEFPTCNNGALFEITNILIDEFSCFRNECEDLVNLEIPAIVYEGNPDSLPDIFSRINSKGITLSKYQILSATWTMYEYKIIDDKLLDIIEYVDKFYGSILENNFSIEGYNPYDIKKTKKLNFYQILFGFGKLISVRYPYFFFRSKNDQNVESSGFSLVNACIGNKNSKLAELPAIIQELFPTDNQFNQFLVNVLNTIDCVYAIFKPYLEFKLNKRKDSKAINQSEFQICSIVSNYFNFKYSTYTYDESGNEIIGRKVLIDRSNADYKKFKKAFKSYAFKRYLVDILNDYWRGSGDSKLNHVSLDKNYYTDEISPKKLENELDHWISNINSRKESKKVAEPKSIEKLLLSIIYSRSFSAYEQNDDINYDIEHLAPKGKLKILIKKVAKNDEQIGLPISSFANICLLREAINRKKKDKTLYEDNKYLQCLYEKEISLQEIEERFSFTTKKDLEWMDKGYTDFNELKEDYFRFLDCRYKIVKKKIIDNLFYNQLEFKNHCANNNKNSQKNLFVKDKSSKYVLSTKSEILYEELSQSEKDILNIVKKMKKNEFDITEMYSYKDELEELYPNNNNLESKIRQNLQHLRDKGYIEFISRGKYRRLK